MPGRMAKCSVKLSTYDIKYEPRSPIKSQALADFVAKFSDDLRVKVEIKAKKLLKRNSIDGHYSKIEHLTKEELDWGSY